MRTTSNNITGLKDNQIFVFGSNLSGIHGAGAAKTAVDKFGAILYNPKGLQGKSYAIPTKDKSIRNTLPIEEIKIYVDRFIEFAKQNQQLEFLVTEIGCGLAGLRAGEVAPLFINAVELKNVCLPEKFWNFINRHFAKRHDFVLICKNDNIESKSLTFGKTYIPFEIDDFDKTLVYIVDDNGEFKRYSINYFFNIEPYEI